MDLSIVKAERVFLPPQQRVIDELKELKERRSKLLTFIQGEIFKTLEQGDKNLLYEQYEAMTWLDVILTKRIERF